MRNKETDRFFAGMFWVLIAVGLTNMMCGNGVGSVACAIVIFALFYSEKA